jgi:hypothetical protein
MRINTIRVVNNPETRLRDLFQVAPSLCQGVIVQLATRTSPLFILSSAIVPALGLGAGATPTILSRVPAQDTQLMKTGNQEERIKH